MPSPYQVPSFPHPVFHQQQLGRFNFNTSNNNSTSTRKVSIATFGGAFIQLFTKSIFPEVVEDEIINNNNASPSSSPSSSPISSPSLSSSSTPIPPLKLGAPGGPEIDNKSTILSEIDQLLGAKKPPAVEFIFVEPYASWNVFFIQGLGLSRNPYGHAAIRYTLPDGTQKVMNIVGFKTETAEMVNFISPEEYFFGTGKFSEGCEQMGVYNRNFVSIRIEDYPDDKIMDLDYYFQKLQRREKEKKVEYSLVTAPIWNFLREWLPIPLQIAERGNCALWTSKGLVEADLLRFPNAWPKSIWVDLYEIWGRKNRENIHVVSYRRVNSAHLTYGKPLYTPSVVEPLNTLQNLSYINLEKFADVIVEVPENSTTAIARKNEPQLQPSIYRHYKFTITTGTCLALYGIFRLLRRK